LADNPLTAPPSYHEELRMPTPPKPISLSDDQLIFIQHLTEPLHPTDRSRFLVDLAAALRHEGELGDGILHRHAREVFRRFFKPPTITSSQASRPGVRASALKAAPAIE
jgi:hypothetical protein